MGAETAAMPALAVSADPAVTATSPAFETLIDRPEWQADWEAEFSAWLSTHPAEPPLPSPGGVARFCGDPLGPDIVDTSGAPWVSADAEDPSAAADRLVSEITTAKQDECLAVWRQLEAMAALLRLWGTRSADADGGPDAEAGAGRGSGRRPANSNAGRLDLDDMAPMCVVTEVALACGTSEYAVGRRLEAAMALITQERLPRTAALASAGALDWPKLQAVVRETSALTPEAPPRSRRLSWIACLISTFRG